MFHEPFRMSTVSTSKSARRDSLWDSLLTIVYALILAMGIRFFIAQPFRIPSGSMQPTLLVGDYIVVTKWTLGYSRFSFEPLNFGWPSGRLFGHEPKRGDVIVFRPVPQEDKDLVKRLIGMPGDRIQMRNDRLYINDQPIERESLGLQTFKEQSGEFVQIAAFRETLPNGVSYVAFDRESDGRLDDTPVFRVPEGSYFMMGDDRDNSADSRTPEVSFVPFDHLVGKVQFVFVSFDPATSFLKPWTLFTGLRTDRLVKGVK
ncbi:MAG: signal peptidase I [Hyphomonadaceae bacterium]